MSKIEFHIENSVKGGETHLEALTIEETNALIEILTALRNIAIHDWSNDIKIGVINESACALIDGDTETMDGIHQNILKVVYNEKDRDNVYVENLLRIKEQVKERDLDMRIVYRKGNDVKDIKEYFDKPFHKRINRKKRESSFILEFMNGQIKRSGETGGNWIGFSIESKSETHRIISTDSQASLAGKFLFKNDSKIAVWGKIDNTGRVHYTCSDIYVDGTDIDYYEEFKSYFKDFFKLSEVERIKSIHYQLKSYYSQDLIGHAKKFIRLFLHSEVEAGYLLSILLLSKKYKKREELKDLLDSAEKLLSEKSKGVII